MSVNNTKSQLKYLQNEGNSQNQQNNHQQRAQPPPISPSNRSKKNSKEEGGYLANFQGELEEDRLHKSKTRSVKLNQSSSNTQMVTSLQVHENLITVKEQKLANSSIRASQVNAFKSEQFADKKVKKFSISALIKEKELIKQSNYFDQSHLAEEYLNPVVNKANADFRMGQIGSFQTFQVKTYLYDRNLNQKINK